MANYLTIHNPISGTGLAARVLHDITAELRRHGSKVVDYSPTSRQDAINAVRRLAAGFDAVISIGGDGTHNTVVAGLVGSPVPIMAVPAGTENIMARALGLWRDPVQVRKVLESGEVRELDVGLANGLPFVIMSGVGFDATVTKEVHERRRGPIKRRNYYWPAVRNWLTYKWPRLTVEVDGREAAREAAFVIVGNMCLYADPLHICAFAKPDDGLLDICIFTKGGRWRLLSYFLSVLVRRHTQRSDIVYRQGRQIVVRPAESNIPFQIDGDAVGDAPVTYTVQPRAVRMFVGHGAICTAPGLVRCRI